MVETATRIYEGNQELARLQKKRKDGPHPQDGGNSYKKQNQGHRGRGSFQNNNNPATPPNNAPAGGSRPSNDATPKGRLNATGKDGQVLRCLICQSQYHLIANCPSKTKIQNALRRDSQRSKN